MRRRLAAHELAEVHYSRCTGLLWLQFTLLAIGMGLSLSILITLRTPHSITPTVTHPGELRILHWNLTSPDTHAWPGVLTDIPECAAADILLLGITMDDGQFRRVIEPLSHTHTIRRIHGLAVASRLEILDLRMIDLNLIPIVRARRLDSASPEPWYQVIYNDHAEALGISRREFDLPDPGYLIELNLRLPQGPRSIYFIDLPSNPFVSRMQIARAVRARITTQGVSDPIAIIGDFNIPGGSASLGVIAPGYLHAANVADDSDRGPTWPRARPLLDIDHAFVKKDCRVRVYRTFDAGLSDHWGQFLIVQPAP